MLSDTVYRLATGRDMSSGSDPTARRRGLIHLFALSATKLADGLVAPKLVLAWLLGALGAPGFLIGALVPVREAGALLPQIAMARQIQRRPRRKYLWATGSLIQGLAALCMAFSALTLEGASAGWVIVGALACLAVARSACSASYKDILARTVEKGTRGTLSGSAATLGAVSVFTFALLLSVGLIPHEPVWIAAALATAGALWIAGALVFLRLDEPDAPGDAQDVDRLSQMFRPLAQDRQLRLFIVTRGLLTATALAPPFLVMLSAGRDDSRLGNLGLLLIASSLAAIASSYLWGRSSDWSSRMTLALAGALAAAALGAAALSGITTGGLGGPWFAALFLFAAQIAYEGVRAGRKTHLTDMEAHGGKAIYTALSNTLVGGILLVGGGFGLLADLIGPAPVLGIFALLSATGALSALRLDHVQKPSSSSAARS